MNQNKIMVPAEMVAKAQAVQANAYSPYSNFKVGVCLRTTQHNFFVGCNYENASFSLTSCAEGSAIAAMVNAGEKQIAEVVVIGSSEHPCSPCGACRQRIREFAAPDILIHMLGNSGESLTMTLDELLPVSFGPKFIK